MEAKRTDCPLCGSTNIHDKYKIGDYVYEISKEAYNISECKDCDLLFMNPMITEEELHNLYSADYYAYGDLKTKPRQTGLIPAIKRLIVHYESMDPKFTDIQNKSVLDVGCGSGQKMLDFKNDGWGTVKGVEIDRAACEVGHRYNLDIFCGTLPDANFPANSFDYVRSNHSLEHIIKMHENAAEMYRVLKPGGKLFIGVPNAASSTHKIFGENWMYLAPPWHAYNYSPKNLTLLLEKHGFKVERIQYNGHSQGTVGSLQIKLNKSMSKGKSARFLFTKPSEIVTHQFARITNLLNAGDCMEIIATK